MMLAQRLYEGVELGREGLVGLITYMRTDSTRVSDDALKEVREFIAGERFGPAYLPAAPNVYKSKKDAQDAHEAIRPTSVLHTPEVVAQYLAEDEMKLYRLIWMRFVASQMMPAVFDQTTIEVAATGKDKREYLFRATGSVPQVRRLPQGLRRRQGSEGRGRRGAEAQAAGRRRRRDAEIPGHQARAALHRAAAAFQRGHAGQRAGV